VHLCDWPEVDPARARDTVLEEDMAVAREAVRLGLAARGQSKIKIRQPLREAVVVAAGRERDAIERHADVVREELNVKALRFVAAADELGSYELKPNYRTLGPRFGKSMPQVAAAVEALDPAHAAAALREGRTVGVNVDGHEHELGPDDVQLALQPLDGYQVEREAGHAVALDLQVDDELRREGWAREAVRAIQNARKQAGLDVSDRIALALGGDGDVLAAVREHEEYVAGETLATSVVYDGGVGGSEARVDGRELLIAVAKS
jgi:isoleucyl-tRNA synthetase